MVEKTPANDFQRWMRALGMHGKQVFEAARRIGIDSTDTAGRRHRGEYELTETERLAMAAVRAGLPPWTPETDQEIADIMEFRSMLDRAAARRSSQMVQAAEHAARPPRSPPA